MLISHLPRMHSRPIKGLDLWKHEDFPESPGSGAFWWKLGISLILVLLGGVFAGPPSIMIVLILGLTLALLSQDEITVSTLEGD